MEFNYDVLCYRVMWRNDLSEQWKVDDYPTEERAFSAYMIIRANYKYAKMLKIEKLI